MMNEQPVLFILAAARHLGGAERSLGALLPELSKRCRLIVFVSTDGIEEEFRRLNLPGLQLVRMGVSASPLAAWANFRILLDWLRNCPPAAILANGHRGALSIALLHLWPMRHRPPCAIYVRDFDYYTFRFTLGAMKGVLFLAPTHAVFDDERYRKWGLGRHRCVALANAVPLPAQTEPPRDNLTTIGCCARIVPWKGIDYLIRAFALVAPAFPKVKLRIVGEPIDKIYLRSLEDLTHELALSDRVEFHPFCRDMEPIYRSSLFFVIPSLSIVPGPETFCRIIIEAWSYARPVIAFACGGPRLLIRDRVDGYLVAERDIEAMAERMKALLADEGLRVGLGAAGRSRAVSEFSAGALTDQLLSMVLPQQ